MDQSYKPIGVLDSGVGGLTIAKALTNALPQESIIYFGDTAHFPYGEKSVEAIQSYAVKIAEFLLERECKLILMACHSASAVAFNCVKSCVGEKAMVINVIDPVVEYLATHNHYQTIGLIGTKPTIRSNVYQQKLQALNLGITLKTCATPLLAPAIEEGLYKHRVIDDLLEIYLNHAKLTAIDALILGCTHYPVITAKIADFYRGKVDIIDAALVVAEKVKQYLLENQLISFHKNREERFFVSDYTESFAETAKVFFGEELKLEHYRL